MLLCASGLRPPDSAGNLAFLRLASEAGCDGILIGDGCALASAAPLATAALRAGLAVGAIAAPLPDTPTPARKRLPHLSSPDRDERTAAVDLALRALALAGSLGSAVVPVGLGPLPLVARPAELARFFQRRELGEGEDGEAHLMAVLGERRAKIGSALDACRWSLDALVREGERRGVPLAMELAATPWGVPSPREGLELLSGYAGARLGLVLDPGRLSAMRRLGLGISAERLAALRSAALLIAANEAVGLEGGFLPGLGEPEPELRAREGVRAGTPVALLGHPDATDSEVVEAAALARAG
jgi:sugar phosphate isomerase/epimerase